VPTAVRGKKRVGLFRTPTAAFVRQSARVRSQDRINYRPCGFYSVFARKERAIASHRVAQKPFIRRFLFRPFLQQVELSLLSDELLSRELDASGESDCRVGGEAEAQVVGLAVSRSGIRE